MSVAAKRFSKLAAGFALGSLRSQGFAYSGMVLEHQSHMREEHGNRGSTDNPYLDEAGNERTLAMMPQTFEKVINNRLYMLHQARFLPGPLIGSKPSKRHL